MKQKAPTDWWIHGCAMPWHTVVEPIASDPPGSHPFRVMPGAFSAALTRTDLPPVRLTVDTWLGRQGAPVEKFTFASTADGTLRFFESEEDGLIFEARLRAEGSHVNTRHRIFERVRLGWIKNVCLTLAAPAPGVDYPPGTPLDITQCPQIGDLSLCDYSGPHCKQTWVRVGRALSSPSTRAVPWSWPPDALLTRPMTGGVTFGAAPLTLDGKQVTLRKATVHG